MAPGRPAGPCWLPWTYIRVAMQIPRPSKIAVTVEIYTMVPSAATREALRKLGQSLDSQPCPTASREIATGR